MTRFTKALRFLQFAVIALALLGGGIMGVFAWLKYPEHDYTKVVPPLTPEEQDIVTELASHTRMLAETIGPRNVSFHPDHLAQAASYIEAQWLALGHAVRREEVASPAGPSDNLYVDVPGQDPDAPWIVIGAHYDSYWDSPGADDNASGVAALLALSRRIPAETLRWPVRLIAFTNEEPPQYGTPAMGSSHHAEHLGDLNVAMMISLETLGFYTAEPETQVYPWPIAPLYPHVGDFVAIVGDLGSRGSTTRLLEGFRRASNFPAGAVTLPEFVDGTGWSDHAAFWRKGIPAVMLTDTAIFRNPYYHTRDDVLGHLDLPSLARVVSGLLGTLQDPVFDPVVPYRFTGR